MTIQEADKAQLIAAGLSASIFPIAIPSLEGGSFYIFRTDVQLNDQNRLTGRFNHADVFSRNFVMGGLNTLERTFPKPALTIRWEFSWPHTHRNS